MRLKAAFKDWRRRRWLRRAGIGREYDAPQFAAGARSGVWVVDPTDLGPASVVYSFGTGDNIAWDLAMIARFGCTVHAFDPTPRACAWLARQQLPPQFAHEALAVAAHDGAVRFAAPARARDVNYRPLGGGAAAAGQLELPAARIASIARRLGHTAIDVLKLDIEGGEYEVLDDLLRNGPPVCQLLVEFHHGEHGIAFARTSAAIARLRSSGFRIAHVSHRGLEFTFVRPGGRAALRSAGTG